MCRAASVSVFLDETRSHCSDYPTEPPILAVVNDSVYLTLTVAERDAVTDADVAAARDLLAAVREYVTEVERVRDLQRAGSHVGAVA